MTKRKKKSSEQPGRVKVAVEEQTLSVPVYYEKQPEQVVTLVAVDQVSEDRLAARRLKDQREQAQAILYGAVRQLKSLNVSYKQIVTEVKRTFDKQESGF